MHQVYIHRCTEGLAGTEDARQAGEHTPFYIAYAHNSRAEQAQHSEPHRTQMDGNWPWSAEHRQTTKGTLTKCTERHAFMQYRALPGRHAPRSDTPHCPKRIHLLPPGTSTRFNVNGRAALLTTIRCTQAVYRCSAQACVHRN